MEGVYFICFVYVVFIVLCKATPFAFKLGVYLETLFADISKEILISIVVIASFKTEKSKIKMRKYSDVLADRLQLS